MVQCETENDDETENGNDEIMLQDKENFLLSNHVTSPHNVHLALPLQKAISLVSR